MMLRLQTPLPLRPILRGLSGLLLAFGLAGVSLYLWSEADRLVYETVQLEQLDDVPQPAPPALSPAPSPAVRTTVTSAPAPAPAVIDPLIIGRLEIPKLAVKAVVRTGIDATTLRRSVGHVPGTPLPGQAGNSVLAAHRDTYFSELKHIERGDLIRVRLRNGKAIDYRVDELAIVGKDAVEVMEDSPGGHRRLTLITCYPFDFIGPAPRRFIVGAAAATPTSVSR